MKRITTLLGAVLLFSCMSYLHAESPKREFRATWLAAVGVDWPNQKIGTPGDATQIAAQKAELVGYLDDLVAGNMNAICYHVRPMADAFYKSNIDLVPWSHYLMGWGMRGKDPGYDPLAYAIEEAHARGLELHAWLNPFRYRAQALPENFYTNDKIANDHPDWILDYTAKEKGTILDPANPDVRAHIVAVVKDIIDNYDVDGIIFDDYFYPYGGTNNEDAASQAKWNTTGMNVHDWRRENIDKLIKAVYDMIAASSKPWVRFGISPFGIWTTDATAATKYDVTLPAGITGSNTYKDLGCNTLSWMQGGYVDYISPQLYWATNEAGQEYATLAKWWSDMAETFTNRLEGNKKVHFFSSQSSADHGTGEIGLQIDYNREYDKLDAPGTIFFSHKNYVSKDFETYLTTNKFTQLSLPPAMDWKATEILAAPTNVTLNGSTLSWSHAKAERFTVYAYTKGTDKTAALASSSNLVGVVYGNSINLSKVSGYASKTLAVCAYDRYGNEYAPAYYNESTTTPENPDPEDPENPEIPAEGTITIDALWTKKEAAVDYISIENANRCIAYYDGMLYIPDYNGKLYVVNAKDGSQKSVVDLTLTGYHRWNVRITDDGQMLGGNTSLSATLTVHAVNKTTGAATALTPTATVGDRSDYFHTYGSWEAGGYALALSNNAVDGKGSVAKIPFLASKLGTPEQITHTDLPTGSSAIAVPAPDGKSFYVAAQGSIPTQHDITTGAKIDAFGTDKPSTGNTSGFGVFTLHGYTYMLTPANRYGKFDIWDITEGLNSATKIDTKDPALSENSNTAAIVDFVVNVSGNDAFIYVLAPNNGVAAYKFTFTPAEVEDPQEPDVTYGALNFYYQGGTLEVPVDNEALWDVMGPQFDAYYPTATTKYATHSEIANINTFITTQHSDGVIKNLDLWLAETGAWKWLGDYMYAHENTLPTGAVNGSFWSPITHWRVSTDAFFKAVTASSLHKNYGVGDWTEAGKPASWQPVYTFAHKPTKSGSTFLGWFNNAEGTGSAFTELPASGDVYACWESDIATDMDNMESIQAISLRPTFDGVEMNFKGTHTIQIYHINGILLQSVVARDSYSCNLPQGIYVICIDNQIYKFVR